MISLTKTDRRGSRKRRGRPPAAGKPCASLKTLRHGLAAISRHNPTIFPDIERRARAICDGDTDPLLFEQALVIAENDIVLQGVRDERVALIERQRDMTAKPLCKRDNSVTRANARFRKAKLKYKQLVQAQAKKGAVDNGAVNKGQEREKPIKSRDEFDAMRHAMPDLDRLARYERRAWSRRKRAVGDFMKIKSRSSG